MSRSSNRLPVAGCSLIALLAALTAASAQDGVTQLRQVTVTGEGGGSGEAMVAKGSTAGTKTDARLIEVPQSISVVTEEQIERQGAQTIGQALRYTPGVIAEKGGGNDGIRYDFQSIRGMSYVGLHYVDGLKATFGTGNLGMPQFDAYNIERIDVVRGPTSVLYGQGYPGGMINIITKKPTLDPRREVEVGVGTDGKVFGTFDFSGPLDEAGQYLYRMTGVGRRADNQTYFVEEERFAIAPSFTWRPSDDTSLTLLGSFQRDPEGGFYSSFPADGLLYPLPDGGYIPRSFFVGEPGFDAFERSQASIGYSFDHRFNEVWKVSQNLRYIHAEATSHSLSAAAVIPPTSLMRSAMYGDATTRSLTVDTNSQADFQTGAVGHSVLFGLDYADSTWDQDLGVAAMGIPPIDVRNPVYGLPIVTPNSPATAMMYSTSRQTQRQVGLYLQEQARWNNFTLTAGGRYDWAELTNDRVSTFLGSDTSGSGKQKDDAFTGRIGLTYAFDNGIAPYVSYSTSFVPTLGADAAGDPFRPTTGQQWEVGVKYEPTWFNGFFSAAVFDIRLEDALTADTNPANICIGQTGPGPCQVQAGEQRHRGFELEAKADLGSGFSLLGAYTYLDAKITESNGLDRGKRPVNTPEHMASLWVDYTFGNDALAGLTIGAGVRHFGASWGDPTNGLRVPSFTLVDAAIRYDFGKKFDQLEGLALSVNATNLSDESYVSCSGATFCNYGAGRSVFGKLSYNW